MVGKFFILAVVCVALAQVQGTELENAIKRGLARAQGINENGRRRIDATIKEVELKSKLIQTKSAEFNQRAARIQTQTTETVGKLAEAMRAKAEESKKPNSVFECIDKAEENCNNQVESLVRKLETDLQRLEKVKLANIETTSTPLKGMQEALRVRYERAMKLINECTNPKCVDTAVNSFSRWLEALSADMSRVRTQVDTVFNNYMRDANNYFNNTNNPINRIKSTTLRNIRQCVFSRRSILEEY